MRQSGTRPCQALEILQLFFSNEKLLEGDEQGIGYRGVKVAAAGPLGSSHRNSEQNDADLDLVGNGGIGGGDKTQLDAGHILKVELIKDLFVNWIGSLRERKESVLTPKFFWSDR